MKRVLIHIGASELQRNSLSWAKEAGMYVVATDANPLAPGRNIADDFLNIDGTNVDGLVSLASRYNATDEVVGAYCNSDFGLEAIGKINEALGLAGCSPEVIRASLHKARAKAAMSENGISVPRGIVISDKSKNFGVGDLDPPLIVKPVDSCGSQGVTHVESCNDVYPAVLEAFRFSEQVMVEEFHDGIGVDTIGILENGKFVPYGIGMRSFSNIPYRFPLHGFTPPQLSTDKISMAYELTARAASALGIRHGPVKADLIYQAGEFIVLEATPRFHGDVFTSKMMVYSSGISPVRDYFEMMSKGRLPERDFPLRSCKPVLWMALFPLQKNLDFRELRNEIQSDYKLIDFYVNPKFSSATTRHRDNRSLAGFFWIEFDFEDQIQEFLTAFGERYAKRICTSRLQFT